MKKLILCVSAILSTWMLSSCHSSKKVSVHKTVNYKVSERDLDAVTQKEKAQLKKEIAQLNELLAEGLIDSVTANSEKVKIAKDFAKRIQQQRDELPKQKGKEVVIITTHKKDTTNIVHIRQTEHDGSIEILEKKKDTHCHKKSQLPRKPMPNTVSLYMAAGFNNLLSPNQSINNSDFKLAGSRFFEMGFMYKYRVLPHSESFAVRTGIVFQFNGLKPTNNRYYVNRGGLVSLETFPENTYKSKMNVYNMVFPLYLEFGPTRAIKTNKGIYYSANKQLRVGLGGYAGFNLGSKQKIKYYNADNNSHKIKLKGDYALNQFVYGVSAYLGINNCYLYGKYDLQPLFKTPNPEQHNLSVGLIFGM